WLLGEAALGTTSRRAAAIPVPAMPFGIIAGARGDSRGYNPLLKGDDDGIIRLSETLLPGAADTIVVPCRHYVLADCPQTVAAVLSFLKHGRFTPER
ncbi:MAG: hypothetical protein K2Q10_02480, partial [Rhodospirillales bacterium]|nr:hypothetical protein [Rhodospirillales bacterium]